MSFLYFYRVKCVEMFISCGCLPMGMKTRAPDMIIVTMRGPSICVEDVMTMKHRDAQSIVSSTHWAFVNGLRMI